MAQKIEVGPITKVVKTDEEWKKLLHHFYDPFPTVEHYDEVDV